jgi:catechol 2,3-dioxygenase-like lactoylglutathione lyase family enzyme
VFNAEAATHGSFTGTGRRVDMKVKGIAWLGTRTANFDAMVKMYKNLMGLDIAHQEPGFAVLRLPNGDKVEVFGDDSAYNTFFTAPVAGFLVDDIASARAEMEAQGIEFIGPIETAEDGNAWSHFRAPDGFIYELTYTPDHPLLED